MKLFNFFQSNRDKLIHNKHEEKLFEIAAHEVSTGNFSAGLYAKAFLKANGDEDKANAEYIRLRVEQLSLEFGTMQDFINEASQYSSVEASQTQNPIDSLTDTTCKVRGCSSQGQENLYGILMCSSCLSVYSGKIRGLTSHDQNAYLKKIIK